MHPLIAVVGPTAVGKSRLALDLARRFEGEIINGDSRQIYRGMDIGTAKVSAQERALVTHHLVDIVEPDEPYSLALYLEQARKPSRTYRKEASSPFWLEAPGSTSGVSWKGSSLLRSHPTKR
jgi:tRNA dimethylallyltransferase